MKVIHLPAFNWNNPFFPLLALHLKDAGIDVDGTTGYLSILQALRGSRYHLIHIHLIEHQVIKFINQMLRFSVYRMAGAKIIKTCHNIRPHSYENGRQAVRCEKMFAQFADHMIFFTEEQRQEFCRYYQFSPKHYSIISHPYLNVYPSEVSYHDARSFLGIDRQDFVYLIFGSVQKYKNYDRVIEVFQEIRGDHDRLLAAIHPSGKSVEHDAFERCRRLLEKDSDHITVHFGFLENDKMQYYFNAADVIVLPYEDNTSSCSFMMTYDFEKPFISISNSFNRHTAGAECGVYIRSIDELKDAMTRIRQCDLNRMKQEIIRRKPYFSWDRVIQQHVETYYACLSK